MLVRPVATAPRRFSVGDIVEAQITLECVPVKDKRFKMVAHLRALALIDGSHTEVRP